MSGDTVPSAVVREEEEGEREVRGEKDVLREAKAERLVDGSKEVDEEKDGEKEALPDELSLMDCEGE